MALKKQTVAIQFTRGLETKADDKVVLPTQLTVLDNGELTKRGTVRCRVGHFALTDATVRGTEIDGELSPEPIGTKLAHAVRGDELLLVTDRRLYSADMATRRWMDRGDYYPVVAVPETVAAVNANQSNPTCATAGGIRVVAWEDSGGGARYSLYNATTGASYTTDTALEGTAKCPTAVPVGDNLVLLWVDEGTTSIRGRLFRAGSPMASVAATYATFVGDLASSDLYAVTTDGVSLFFLYHSDGSVVTAGVAACRTNAAATTAWKVSVSGDTPTCLDIACSTGLLQTVWYDGTDIRTARLNDAGASGGVASFETVANVVRVAAGASSPPTLGLDFAYAWEVDAASDDLNTVSIFDPAADTRTVQHAQLISSGFQLAGGRACFILGHASRTGLQNSFYLYTDDAVCIGQLLYQTANLLTGPHLARVFGLETALGFKRQLDIEGTTGVFTNSGVSHVTFTQPNPSYAEAGGTCYLSGSLLSAYDGQYVTEANTLMYPDMLTADLVASNGTGSLDVTEQYSYRVYYEFTRANGERVRSAALTRSITLGASDDTVTLTIPTLAFTRAEVSIKIYRSIGNDTTGLYYLVSGSNPATVTGNNRYVYNDTAAATVTFVDGRSDAALVANEIDYQSRGELEHIAPPGPAIVCSVADRLFLAGGQVPKGTVRYSKLRFFGEPAEFSDTLAIDDLPEVPGAITNLSFVNETLVALRESGISAVGGEGLDNTGLSGSYQSEAVTTDVGCTGAAVVYPQGILFASAKGIYLLDQSFNVGYLGAPVERYNNQVYTGATVIPGTNQVLFLTSSGSSVMYDYHFNEWAAWSLEGTGLVLWNDTIAFLQSSGLTLYRDTAAYDDATFTDAGHPYNFRMRTGPLRLTEVLQDFARMYKFSLLGTYRSPHRLLVDLLYDRETAAYESITWDPATVIVESTWGSDDTWGSGDVWGGTRESSTYQFEHRPQRQKFSTIRFEFSMVPGIHPGAGYELTELALLVGIKPGLQRHGIARKY